MNTWKQTTIKNGEVAGERIIDSDKFVKLLAQMIFLRQAGEDLTLMPEVADSSYAVTAYVCTRNHKDGTVVTRFEKQ